MTNRLALHLGTTGGVKTFREMHEGEQGTVKQVHQLRDASTNLTGSTAPTGAIVFSRGDGQRFGASGNLDKHAAEIALQTAADAGYRSNITLAVSVPDNTCANPLSAEILTALSQFGPATVLLVGDDRSVVIATLTDR